MRPAASTQTLRIATARLEFSSRRRLAQALHAVTVAALLGLVIVIARHLLADSLATQAALEDLTRQNATLQADLARARTELELERSTREALTRQVTEMNAETNELQSRLAFFNSQTGQSRASR